jgi:hypothetical protein
MAAMNDIMGPDAMAMVAGAMYGYTTGDESATFRENVIRFAAGGLVGLSVGRGITRAGFGGNKEQYNQFLREGGGQFGIYDRSGRINPEQMIKELKGLGVDQADLINPRGWGHAIQLIGAPIRMLADAARAIETAPRLAFHKRNLKRAGVNMSMRTRTDISAKTKSVVSESIFGSRDLSLDFSVKGASPLVKGYTAATPFANPMLLGMDKLVRLMDDKSTREVAAATILAPTMALWLVNHLDPVTAQA